MSPKRIVEMAMLKKLDIIGICDHNSAENVQAAINAANILSRDRACPCPSITVLFGMEICTKEEIHILCLFDKSTNVMKMQGIVYQNLPEEKNKPEIFGEQIIANEFDEVEAYNDRLLIGACNLTVKEVVDEIHTLNGIAIASHIDRESFSLIGQLGFIPEDLRLDAVEISPNATPAEVMKKFPEITKYPIIRSSDAHFLEDIGKATTTLRLEEPTVDEIRLALKSEKERKVILQW